jgi:hypothetical protein
MSAYAVKRARHIVFARYQSGEILCQLPTVFIDFGKHFGVAWPTICMQQNRPITEFIVTHAPTSAPAVTLSRHSRISTAASPLLDVSSLHSLVSTRRRAAVLRYNSLRHAKL